MDKDKYDMLEIGWKACQNDANWIYPFLGIQKTNVIIFVDISL